MKVLELSVFQKVCDLTKGALCRFPLAIMFCTWSGAALLYAEGRHGDSQAWWGLFLLMAAMAMILQVMGETRQWPRLKNLCIQVIGLVALCAVYWFLIHDIQQLTGLALALSFAFLSLPLLRKDIDDEQIWTYYFHVLMGLIFAAIAAIFACLAISSIAMGVRVVLETGSLRKFSEFNRVFCAVVFFPIAFMGLLPKSFDERRASSYLLSGISFLLNYILVPLAFIQIIIMYGFLAKSFVTWNIQNVGVARVILMFFALGLVFFVATYPFRKTGTGLLRFFYATFFLCFLVPLLSAGALLLVRIYHYGLTDLRYLAVGAVIAMLCLTVLHILAPARRRLAEIPFALALVAVTSFAGPVGAVDVSLHSQKSQLTALMQKYDLLDAETGLVKVNVQTVTPEVSRRFGSIVEYFIRKGDLSLIRDWVLPLDVMKLGKLKGANYLARHFDDETLVCTKKFRNKCSNRFGGNWEGAVINAWGIRSQAYPQRYVPFMRHQSLVPLTTRRAAGTVLRVAPYAYLSSFEVAAWSKSYAFFLNEAQERLDIAVGLDVTGHFLLFTERGGGEEAATKLDIKSFVDEVLQRETEADEQKVKTKAVITLTSADSLRMTYKIDRADFQAEVRLKNILFERDQEEGPIRITRIEGEMLFSLPE